MPRAIEQIKTGLKHPQNFEYAFLAIPVWFFILTCRVFLFYKLGKTNYTNISDSILYPFLGTALFLIALFILDTFYKFRASELRKIMSEQVLILYVYFLYYFTNLEIRTLFLFHAVMAICLLGYRISQRLNADQKRKLFFGMAAAALLFLFFNNSAPVTGRFSILNSDFIHDSYSEKHSYNSAIWYIDHPQDIGKYYLLPVLEYPGSPYQVDPNVQTPYTHYPAGADTLLLTMVKVMGRHDSMEPYRVLPFIIYLIGFVFLIKYFMTIGFNRIIALMASLLVVLQPAIDKFKFDLYYHSYAYSLFFILLFVVASYLKQPGRKKLAVIFILGFLELWLSFDFLPIVLLSTIPIIFLPFYKKHGTLSKQTLAPFATVLAGFVVGMVTRLIQTTLYFKSLSLTIQDLIDIFKYRSGGLFEGLPPGAFYIDSVIKTYTTNYIDQASYFGYPLLFLVVIVAVIMIIIVLNWDRLGLKDKIISFRVFRNASIFLWISIGVSMLWVYFMRNHSAIHAYVITRHFILILIAILSLGCLFVKRQWDLKSNK